MAVRQWFERRSRLDLGLRHLAPPFLPDRQYWVAGALPAFPATVASTAQFVLVGHLPPIVPRHFARYTPEMVERTTGCPQETFLRVAETLTANSGHERTSSFCSTTPATSPVLAPTPACWSERSWKCS